MIETLEMALLPFGKGLKIFIDGEFVDDFDIIDVGIVDIDSTDEIIAPVFNPANEVNNVCVDVSSCIRTT